MQQVWGRPYHRLASSSRHGGWKLLAAVVGGLALMLAAQLAVAFVTIAVVVGVGGSRDVLDPSRGVTPVLLLAVNIALGLLIPLSMLLGWLLYRQPLAWMISVRPGVRRRWLLASLALVGGIWGVILALNVVGAVLLRKSALDATVVGLIVVVLLTTPLQAAGEEFMFRGLLLQALGAVRTPTWLCCLLSGLLFAVAHLQFQPFLFADRLMLGVVWAAVVVRTGGLEVSVVMHAVKNVVVFVPAAILGQTTQTVDPSGTVTAAPLVFDAVLLVLTVPFLLLLARKRAERVAGQLRGAIVTPRYQPPAPPRNWPP